MLFEVYTTSEKVTMFETIGRGSSTFVHFCFLKKTENYSWSISCHVTEGQSQEFISFFAIEYNIRLWDGPKPFGKIPDPRWHISLAKKGALDHISFGECFLLLVFSNKTWESQRVSCQFVPRYILLKGWFEKVSQGDGISKKSPK